MEPVINVLKLRPTAIPPTRAFRSAGYDLYAPQDVDLTPGKVTLVKLGLAVEFPRGYAALIWDRSGMGKNGIHVFGGVIDDDYRGEWGVLLFNSTKTIYTVRASDRVAQALFQKVEHWAVKEVDSLSTTERGTGAMGSTGR